MVPHLGEVSQPHTDGQAGVSRNRETDRAIIWEAIRSEGKFQAFIFLIDEANNFGWQSQA